MNFLGFLQSLLGGNRNHLCTSWTFLFPDFRKAADLLGCAWRFDNFSRISVLSGISNVWD